MGVVVIYGIIAMLTNNEKKSKMTSLRDVLLYKFKIPLPISVLPRKMYSLQK